MQNISIRIEWVLYSKIINQILSIRFLLKFLTIFMYNYYYYKYTT